MGDFFLRAKTKKKLEINAKNREKKRKKSSKGVNFEDLFMSRGVKV